MAWTNIPNANLDVGAPLRSVDILALRDNITALANGDTGAPPIKAQALGAGQTGNAPIFAARAFVNFQGEGVFSPNPSTSKILASGNVSSITKNGTGDYTINLAVAMPNANYSIYAATRAPNPQDQPFIPSQLSPSTTGYPIRTGVGGQLFDHSNVYTGIFG